MCYMNKNTGKKLMVTMVAAAMALGTGTTSFAATGNTNAEVQEGGNWYEMMVSSFCDSDGDGIGDFRGAEQKLDYLESLGITGIWVMPINKSNSSPYSTIDYYGLNPDLGTMQDLKSFLRR